MFTRSRVEPEQIEDLEARFARVALEAQSGNDGPTADEIVHQRDAEHDAARLAADLAAAPESDRKRLAAETARQVALQAAVTTAKQAAETARNGIVAARMAGKSDDKAMQTYDAADAAVDHAVWDRDLQSEVVTGLRDQIISVVRAGQEGKARAKLADARERWQAALSRLAPAYDAIAGLSEAHRAEQAAADELAYALGQFRHKFDAQGLRERRGPDGSGYVSTAEPSITISVNGEVIQTAGELSARLRVGS